jgi:hypothetical protein
VNVFQNAFDNATVQPAGPRAGASGKSYVNVENAGAGANASYNVLDYNDPTLHFSPLSAVGTINEVSLSTVTGFPVSAFQHSGTFNVYVVDDSTTDIQPGTSPLIFDTAADATEGLGTQLGAKHLLGTISYDSSQPTGVFSSFPLTSTDAATLAVLKADLNNGTKFRVVVTPDDSGVAASWEGQFTSKGLLESPVLSFNYTPAVVTLPAWLDPASMATWAAPPTRLLTLHGSATIVGDPASDQPVIVSDSPGTSLVVEPTSGVHDIHVASIVAGALMIGGSAGNPVTVIIAASDANGNPLAAAPSSIVGASGFSASDRAAGATQAEVVPSFDSPVPTASGSASQDSIKATSGISFNSAMGATHTATTAVEIASHSTILEFLSVDRFEQMIDALLPSTIENRLAAASLQSVDGQTAPSLQNSQSPPSVSDKLDSLDAALALEFSNSDEFRWSASTSADAASDDNMSAGLASEPRELLAASLGR